MNVAPATAITMAMRVTVGFTTETVPTGGG
jgi:hypothetical protein